MPSHFVPASGYGILFPLYDPAVALFTREHVFKTHLLDRAQLQSQTSLLDVGCGTGTFVVEAARRAPHLQITGVDADPRALRVAKSKAAEIELLKFERANAQELNQRDAQFDVVTATLLLHHLLPEEKAQAFSEMYRVLKPTGCLLVADYCRPANRKAFLAFQAVRCVDGWLRTRCNLHGRLAGMMESAGFVDVQETLTMNTLLGTIRCYAAQKTL